MSCKEVFKIINELYPEYVRVWEDVCNRRSYQIGSSFFFFFFGGDLSGKN